ncbi:hypothetical protein CTAYLR_007322 [Chrysophaeum taylorii]|uniref:Metallo-beta-lactamase domain-containing protein n=1 Tax=Chrysophaeum taylorii TaxID=2483200 RepID=A0AAD7U9I3_9STRA|nr:hypothetical protein CTAYLR_007322 [Chrysophaeum taylorii]
MRAIVVAIASVVAAAKRRDRECKDVGSALTDLVPALPRQNWAANGSTFVTQSLGNDSYAIVTAQYQTKIDEETPVTSVLNEYPITTTSGGIIVTDKGVIVIEAFINRFLACQVLDLIEDLDPKKPKIKYVAITNFHGDHAFGTAVFDNPDITYVLHQNTYEHLTGSGLQSEIALLEDSFGFGRDAGIRATAQAAVYDPAITISNESGSFTLDGRTIETLYFGYLQSDGDQLIWDPTSRSLWCGNMVVGPYKLPVKLDGGVDLAIDSYGRFKDWLVAAGPPMNVVPGHGYPMDHDTTLATVDFMIDYMIALLAAAEDAVANNLTIPELCATYPAQVILNSTDPLFSLFGIHSINLINTFLEASGEDVQGSINFCPFPNSP